MVSFRKGTVLPKEDGITFIVTGLQTKKYEGRLGLLQLSECFGGLSLESIDKSGCFEVL